VDYRALNLITEKDAHPLPRMNESITRFHGMTHFTTLDLKSGYWQIPIDQNSKAKTAFSSRYGHFQWNVLPFGLTNAPAAFQRRMIRILSKYLDIFCVVYLDDILIYSKSAEEHEKHVRIVLKALEEAGMILNIKKCSFFTPEVRFLGHIISENGSRPDPRNIEKVINWPTPKNITDVRGFNNLAVQFLRYTPKLAEIAKPLTDLQKGAPPKGAPIVWTDVEDRAFKAMKKAITTQPILKHPDSTKPFYIDSDASQYAIGAVLLQEHYSEAKKKMRMYPLAYESKKLSETEQRYSAQERELLAINYALNHWRHIIEGYEIVVRTDHESLGIFRSKKHQPKRLMRFINEIEHYDPRIIYRPGRLQTVPDALSRRPGNKEEGEPADTERFLEISEENGGNKPNEEKESNKEVRRTGGDKPVGEGVEEVERGNRNENENMVDENKSNQNKERTDEVDKSEKTDGDKSDEEDRTKGRRTLNSAVYGKIKRYLEGALDGTWDTTGMDEDDINRIKEQAESYELKDGTLWRKGKDLEIVFELFDLEKRIEQAHKDLGHYGKSVTADAIKKRTEVAKDLWDKALTIIDACVPCQLFKKDLRKYPETATIHPYREQKAFDFWEMDFIGPLVRSNNGNEYLITAIDYATAKTFVYVRMEVRKISRDGKIKEISVYCVCYRSKRRGQVKTR